MARCLQMASWTLLMLGVFAGLSSSGAEAGKAGVLSRRTNDVQAAGLFPKAASTNQPSAVVVPSVPGFQLRSNDCVAFVGGRTMLADAQYGYLEMLLARHYSGKKIRFVNLAWEGDTVFRQERPLNFGDLSRHLKEQRVTAAVLSFGLMESLQGEKGLAEFVRAYDRLLEELSLVTSRLVLLSPHRRERRGPLLSDPTAENENLSLYAAAIADLADRRRLAFVDLFRVRRPEARGEEATFLTDDGLHLSAYGHWRAACEVERALGLPQPDWTVEINVASRKSEATGTTLSKVEITGLSVRFQAFDALLPGPVFRRDETNLSIWEKRSLKITGLAPGRYVLKIDGRPLYEKGHIFWEKGWSLTHGPEFDQAEAVREAIRQKNAEFFNYWRPQNWAFLQGDLTEQPSSRLHDNPKLRWFPEEMKGFLPLISRKETEIDRLTSTRPHVYELTRKE